MLYFLKVFNISSNGEQSFSYSGSLYLTDPNDAPGIVLSSFNSFSEKIDKSIKSSFIIPSIPYLAAYTFFIPYLYASYISPKAEEFMTLVGPPDWP